LYFELLNELVMQSTLFYVYFGFIFVTIGMVLFFILQANLTSESLTYHVEEKVEEQTIVNILPVRLDEQFITWFIRTYRKANIIPDDLEPLRISLLKMNDLIGGFKWKRKTRYLQNLGNILL